MTEITGRDGYIIAKALAYAIEAIGRLPEEAQEASDREDMIALLNHHSPKDADRERKAARAHLTREWAPKGPRAVELDEE
jgi:hypothetical protein